MALREDRAAQEHVRTLAYNLNNLITLRENRTSQEHVETLSLTPSSLRNSQTHSTRSQPLPPPQRTSMNSRETPMKVRVIPPITNAVINQRYSAEFERKIVIQVPSDQSMELVLAVIDDDNSRMDDHTEKVLNANTLSLIMLIMLITLIIRITLNLYPLPQASLVLFSSLFLMNDQHN